MTQHKLTKLLLGLSVVVLALSACGPRVSTPSPEQMKTYVAETIAVQLTRTEIARPTETPKPTLAPSPTLAPPLPQLQFQLPRLVFPPALSPDQSQPLRRQHKQVLMRRLDLQFTSRRYQRHRWRKI